MPKKNREEKVIKKGVNILEEHNRAIKGENRAIGGAKRRRQSTKGANRAKSRQSHWRKKSELLDPSEEADRAIRARMPKNTLSEVGELGVIQIHYQRWKFLTLFS